MDSDRVHYSLSARQSHKENRGLSLRLLGEGGLGWEVSLSIKDSKVT